VVIPDYPYLIRLVAAIYHYELIDQAKEKWKNPVKRHIQSNGIFHVRQRLAVRVGQPRKTSKVHPNAQIGALDV